MTKRKISRKDIMKNAMAIGGGTMMGVAISQIVLMIFGLLLYMNGVRIRKKNPDSTTGLGFMITGCVIGGASFAQTTGLLE